MRTRAPLGGCRELVSIRDRVRLAQRGSVSGLDALPPGAGRSQRGTAGLQALPRVADALPRHTAQRQDASPLSQRARARSLRLRRKWAVSVHYQAGNSGVSGFLCDESYTAREGQEQLWRRTQQKDFRRSYWISCWRDVTRRRYWIPVV